jgi:hypothetical protein
MTPFGAKRRTVAIDFLYLDSEVCENLLRLFRSRERSAESACCDARQQESCCPPSEKASCCGAPKEADARACGCQ